MFILLVMLGTGIGPTGDFWSSHFPASNAVCAFNRRGTARDTMQIEMTLQNKTIIRNGLPLVHDILDFAQNVNVTHTRAEYGDFYYPPVHGWVGIQKDQLVILDPDRTYFATTLNRSTGRITAIALGSNTTGSVVLSIAILCSSFVVRAVKLNRTTSGWANVSARKRISKLFRAGLTRAYTWSGADIPSMNWKQTLFYRPFLVVFLVGRLTLDLYSSLLFEVSLCYHFPNTTANVQRYFGLL
jgi:hypothetical protein